MKKWRSVLDYLPVTYAKQAVTKKPEQNAPTDLENQAKISLKNEATRICDRIEKLIEAQTFNLTIETTDKLRTLIYVIRELSEPDNSNRFK